MLYAIAKGMDQNIVALHTTNGMLDKDANATQGGIGSFLLIAQLWGGVLLTLAWLPRRDSNLLTSVIRFAQFISVCSASNQAAARCISSPVQGSSPAKT